MQNISIIVVADGETAFNAGNAVTMETASGDATVVVPSLNGGKAKL